MSNKPLYLSFFFATTTIILGVIVLAGWYLHHTTLIQVFPNFAPMQYNTALGFLTGGLGLFFVLLQLRYLSIFFGVTTFLIGFLTLVQYILDINLHIDELLMEGYLMDQTSHPGRMAPNTALCFTLSGTCTILFSQWRRKYIESALEIIGMLITALALTALLGYIQGIEKTYGWGSYTRMALHTVLGFILLGLGNSIHVWNLKDKREFTLPLAVLFLLCVCILHFDFVSPLGVATGAAYCLLLFCSLWFSDPKSVFILAVIASILTLTGLFISPETNTDLSIAIVNRVISLAVIWILAQLIYQLRKTQMESQENAIRLDTIIQYSHTGIITIDENGIIESFNHSCQTMFGYTEPEVTGQNVMMLMPEPWHSEHNQYLAQYKNTGTTKIIGQGRRILAKRKDGSEFPIDLAVTEVNLGNRKIFSGQVRDISELEQLNTQLENEKHLLTMLMDNIPDSIYFKDTERRFVRVNKGQARLLGIQNPADALGKRDEDFFVEDMAASTKEEEENIIETQTPLLNYQREVLDKNGARRWHLDTKIPLVNAEGVCTGIVGTARDITSIKESEEKLKHFNTQLEYEKNLLQIIMDFLPEYIYFKDRESKFIRINKNLMNFFHLTDPSEAVGKSDRDFFSAEFAEETYQQEQRVIHTQEPIIDAIAEIHDFEGNAGYYIYTKLPMYNSEGECIGIVGVSKDITEMKQTEQALIKQQAELETLNALLNQEKDLLQILMDNMPENIYLKDTESRFIRINKNLADLFHISDPNEAIGHNDQDYFSPEYAHSTMVEEKEIMETKVPMIDKIKEIYDDEGNHRFYIDTKLPMLDLHGNCTGIVGVAKEITEIKKTEQELIKQREELAKTNQQLNEFAYIASHDLQEPLRTVSNYMALLKRKFGDTLEADALRYVDNAVDATKRMTTLIYDLLTFSRVTTHASKFVTVDLNGIVETVIKNLDHSIQEKQAVIQFGTLPTIQADAGQITQLMQNFIGNALKYVENKAPQVNISYQDQQTEWQFSIQDNGIGIEPKFHERIFKAFQRLHTREEYSGTGIGLAICQRIVERHGGRIWVDSEEGKGSTFYFTISKTLENE